MSATNLIDRTATTRTRKPTDRTSAKRSAGDQIADTVKRSRPAKSSADDTANLAKSFNLNALATDLHGKTVRDQLLSSYIEWLAMEQRLATSELWPQLPDDMVVVPCNTRWGKGHFGSARFPAAKWTDFKHPLTRAALVLWTVGALDDLGDPLHDLVRRLREVEEQMDANSRIEDGSQLVQEQTAILERLRSAPPTPATMPGAAAALRFVIEEFDRDSDDTRRTAILNAVIGFLEREDPKHVANVPSPYNAPTEQIDAMWRRWIELRDAHHAAGSVEEDATYEALSSFENDMALSTGSSPNDIASRILLTLMTQEGQEESWSCSEFPWPHDTYRLVLADLRPQVSGVLRWHLEEMFTAGNVPCRSLSFWRK